MSRVFARCLDCRIAAGDTPISFLSALICSLQRGSCLSPFQSGCFALNAASRSLSNRLLDTFTDSGFESVGRGVRVS